MGEVGAEEGGQTLLLLDVHAASVVLMAMFMVLVTGLAIFLHLLSISPRFQFSMY